MVTFSRIARTMIVSAWHDGGSSFGLRVQEDNVSLYFRPEWIEVTLHLPGQIRPIRVPLTESFWSSAPELRSPGIRHFFERHGLVPWEKKRPPHFELEPLGGGSFRLHWLERFEGQFSLPLDL
jgi:hypothetical protein